MTGEVSAELISRHLYNKAPSELTESEKKNVAALSQISAGIAGGIIGGSSAAGLSSAEVGKRAVENNYLNNLEVENLVRELAQAEKEGKDPKAIFEKYEQISEANRQSMIEECGNNPVCYLPHIYQMGTGNEEAYENLSGLRFTSYKNGLSGTLKGEMVTFVENENANSYAVLPSSVHYAGMVMDAATAAGLGGFSLAGKWKDKPYTSSGMDKHSREKVGDSDYPDNIHFNIKLKTHFIEGEGLSQKTGIIGTHNEVNFRNSLDQYGGRVSRIENTDVDGITRIYYQIPRLGRDGKPDGTYKDVPSPKTVYDPNKYSDSYILEMGMKAAAKGYNQNLDKRIYDSSINGIPFRIYLDQLSKAVENVHPK